ncbi:MAG TPA: type II toxin-antitoxin system HicB family antitoxin [Terriglobales bacterium]|nr:type II toxin-antitoxin system HicB family antitoxin [Terriglobales bacterium]
MRHLQHTIKAVIHPGEQGGFVGECVEIAVVSQGLTIDETIENLREAVALHLEGEHAAEFGLVDRPSLIVTLEVAPSYADRRLRPCPGVQSV